MSGWRVLPLHVAPAAEQLALTESLWRAVAAGHTGDAPASLRWYSYDTPALILGVGQSEQAVVGPAAHVDGMQVVKRSSGGAVVYARPGFIALDVALPSESPLVVPDVVESYRWLGQAFMRALTTLAPQHAERLTLVRPTDARADQQAQRTSDSGTPPLARALACFGVLSPYEVALDGRKLIGLSQIRKRGVALFQAGVYCTLTGEELARYLPPMPGLGAELDGRIASLSGLGLASPDDFVQAVTRAITESAPEP